MDDCRSKNLRIYALIPFHTRLYSVIPGNNHKIINEHVEHHFISIADVTSSTIHSRLRICAQYGQWYETKEMGKCQDNRDLTRSL